MDTEKKIDFVINLLPIFLLVLKGGKEAIKVIEEALDALKGGKEAIKVIEEALDALKGGVTPQEIEDIVAKRKAAIEAALQEASE